MFSEKVTLLSVMSVLFKPFLTGTFCDVQMNAPELILKTKEQKGSAVATGDPGKSGHREVVMG